MNTYSGGMPSKVDAFKVFIASPGGMEGERKAIREEIEHFNSTFLDQDEVIFSSQGWENVPGGARRPQGSLTRRSYLATMRYWLLGQGGVLNLPLTAGSLLEPKKSSILRKIASMMTRAQCVICWFFLKVSLRSN